MANNKQQAEGSNRLLRSLNYSSTLQDADLPEGDYPMDGIGEWGQLPDFNSKLKPSILGVTPSAAASIAANNTRPGIIENHPEVQRCEVPTEDQDKKEYSLETALELSGHGRYNYLMLFTCSLIVNAVALDMFGYATVVAAASCDLDLDLTRHGILAAAPFIGVVFAYPWGYYADTQGRWRSMVLSTSVGFVFAVASSFSTHWLFMLAMKIIGTSFSMACLTLTIAMLGESTNKKHRSQYLFIMNSFNLIEELFGFFLAWLILPLKINLPLTWLGTTFRSWRLYTLVMAIPLGIGAALMFGLYESPKFLASRGNDEKALEILGKIYERNGGIREEYPVKHLVLTSSDLENSTDTKSLWNSLKKQTLPIFQPPLLWRTLQLFFLMIVCCVTNNVFVMWYPTFVNYFFTSINQANSSSSGVEQTFCERMFKDTNTSITTHTYKCNEELSVYTLYSGMLFGLFYGVCGLAVVKVASRPRLLLILILLISGISFLLVNIRQPIANMIFFTLLQDTSLGVGCISTYFVDLYPTTHRGLVTSLSMMVTRVFDMVAVSLIGNIITEYCEVTFYTWSVFIFAGIVVSLFLPPDRKGKENKNCV